MISAGNCAEGRLVDGIDVLIPASLLELVEHLRGEKVLDVLDKGSYLRGSNQCL